MTISRTDSLSPTHKWSIKTKTTNKIRIKIKIINRTSRWDLTKPIMMTSDTMLKKKTTKIFKYIILKEQKASKTNNMI